MKTENATPAAGQLAVELGYAIENISGSGKDGRVLVKDVRQFDSMTRVIQDVVGEFQQAGEGGSRFLEVGQTGLDYASGLIREAYLTKLTWPTCAAIYSKLRRSDPEVAITRVAFETLGRDIGIEFGLDKDAIDVPTGDDQRAVDFANQVLDDLDGGISNWRDNLLTQVPFYGWGWWEIVPGLRVDGWRAPQQDDEWESKYTDGLIGIRRLGWRDPTSFSKWDLSENGRVLGMYQSAGSRMINDIRIPKSESVHITFGDATNPEGLTPLEALHRLERIKYSLEFIQGRGFERAAGHVRFTTEGKLTAKDKYIIEQAAKALLTAQEGNYVALPENIKSELLDVTFSAAAAILDAIKHYSTLKLQLYFMQWVTMATASSGVGSYAAMDDASGMFITFFNAMMQGFVQQCGTQLARWIFNQPENQARFPGITRLPILNATALRKQRALKDMGDFVQIIKDVMPLGTQDIIRIREESDFLPKELPQDDEVVSTPAAAAPQMGWDGRYKQLNNQQLARFTASMENVMVQLRADPGSLPNLRGEYFATIKDTVIEYIDEPGARVTSYRNIVKQAVADFLVAAFLTGYYESSGVDSPGDVDQDARSWLAGKQASEIMYVDDLFDAARELKQDIRNDEDGEYTGFDVIDFAHTRAGYYTRSLDGVYNEGKLRGNKKIMLIFGGEDGEDSCKTCQKWKGKRHSAQFWLKRNLVPGQPGNHNFECGGWKCHHYLFDDDGNVYTYNDIQQIVA